MLAPYFAASSLRGRLADVCRQAFSFDAPLRPLAGDGDYLLELFHGPTAAFKDYAARFLDEALSQLRTDDAPPVTILVATSGDKGAAVAARSEERRVGQAGVSTCISRGATDHKKTKNTT